ncbi:MAG: hypothetical protein IIA49_05280, partial [Bacteroidetes bacterium]|nr:hypothetical protein [Bacteroidota bacterium]
MKNDYEAVRNGDKNDLSLKQWNDLLGFHKGGSSNRRSSLDVKDTSGGSLRASIFIAMTGQNDLSDSSDKVTGREVRGNRGALNSFCNKLKREVRRIIANNYKQERKDCKKQERERKRKENRAPERAPRARPGNSQGSTNRMKLRERQAAKRAARRKARKNRRAARIVAHLVRKSRRRSPSLVGDTPIYDTLSAFEDVELFFSSDAIGDTENF